MIYISYGITKSASTFLYQLTEEILRQAGFKVVLLPESVKGRNSPENYIDPINAKALELIEKEIGKDTVVVKTHGAPDQKVTEAVSLGNVYANALIRDPREIAISLIEHGQKSRKLGINDFTQFIRPVDALDTLRDQFIRFEKWASIENTLILTYNDVCFSTQEVIGKIAAQLGIYVNPQPILEYFGDKDVIGQYNIGIKDRYTELSEVDNEIFLKEFASYYKGGIFSLAK